MSEAAEPPAGKRPVERGLTYREAGVDRERADAVKSKLAGLVNATRTPAVQAGFGSFAGRFRVADEVLVASADGVGTKLKVAFRAGRHDTVGEDLVNHCVNDILAEGATPLVFLDYFASGVLDPRVTVEVVTGVARGCRRNECALLGGETAEMPDVYAPGEYDLAGFVVGRIAFPEVAARDLRAGDRLLALASDGFHTNGYTFLRRLLFDRLALDVDDAWPDLGARVGDVLLRLHRSYLQPLRAVCAAGKVRGLAHVTGGGIPGNLVRILPADLDAVVDVRSWSPPAEFAFVAEASGAEPLELYRTLNMGVGMIAVVRAGDDAQVRAAVEEAGCPTWVCGEVREGTGQVHLKGLS